VDTPIRIGLAVFVFSIALTKVDSDMGDECTLFPFLFCSVIEDE